VWAGRGTRPIAFCKTKEEVNATLQGLDTKQLSNVTIGTLSQIKPKISAEF
jgi:hypothetical protein